ncbi:hypothetical protein SCHPADRAFT_558646 [Schizopora paradoxa]|uniref:Uncharacterized protein n=1 Tax=Schizopora paradoxa TaxID=27342 RepID=A0A0H2RJK3_9AGAM|nr:hypothetical protein SCHPADRAFT_558646 [Schizopora paradoxa]
MEEIASFVSNSFETTFKSPQQLEQEEQFLGMMDEKASHSCLPEGAQNLEISSLSPMAGSRPRSCLSKCGLGCFLLQSPDSRRRRLAKKHARLSSTTPHTLFTSLSTSRSSRLHGFPCEGARSELGKIRMLMLDVDIIRLFSSGEALT